MLAERGLARSGRLTSPPRFLATDSPERFARVGATFLGAAIAADKVEVVDLHG
jgi:glutamate racemase